MRASQDVLLESIEQLACRLWLPHLRRVAPEVLKTARSQRWDPGEALRTLLEHEADGSDTSAHEIRRAIAGFPNQKILRTWSEAASSIPQHVQHALQTLEWIWRRENLALCGPSGTAKSHYLEALGRHAIDHDHKVVWFSLEDLGDLMKRHRIDHSSSRAIRRISEADLACIDDIGLLPASPDATEGFFRVIDAAYERYSLTISSRRHPSWR